MSTLPAPTQHLLTNGHYRVAITASGAGYSALDWIALTRWRNDAIQDDLGSIIYLRDLDLGDVWSLGYQPMRMTPAHYSTGCTDDEFRLEREDFGIVAQMTLTVDPAVNRELRQLTLINRTSRPRRIELTSYLEVVLFHPDGDAAHPAFAKLFIQTERDPISGALLARRRPRAAHEQWPWLVHGLVGAVASEWETDRMAFIGRGRTVANPFALTDAASLTGTLGNVLDPILALRTVVELAAGATVELTFITGAAMERDTALKYIPVHAQNPPDFIVNKSENVANHCGQFSPDGTEYRIELPWNGSELQRPPLPWINVIANPQFGLLISETGAGYTWSRNSQANRLTQWANDPVSDPPGEAFYLRDETSGAAWSPLPAPCPAPVNYQTRHGFGYSTFHCDFNGLAQDATVFVHRDAPLRVLRLQLTNTGAAPRQLSAFSYQRLVMGNQPQTASAIVTAHDAERDVLTAVNPQADDFAGGIVFAAARLFGAEIEARAHSGDRLSFIGRHRDLTAPAALEPNAQLDNRTGSGLDPCLAQQLSFTLAPGQTATLVWLFGEVMSEAELTALLAQHQDAPAIAAALAAAQEFWRDMVTRIQVQTPEPAIDLMLNGWITYQNLGCRIWARSAFYQSGGAFGYRDQLQDAAALVVMRPELTRQQILLHAAQQFVEGDVLHWWHPAPIGRGLRTRFADDLLWLPFVTAHYIRVTGDAAILDEMIPFLTAPLLAPGEDEAYLQPQPSGEVADLYEHCCRTLERSLAVGAHGLPLMGTGDWNDGMNRIGREGRGESVWMGFFLYRILGDFIPLCAARGDDAAVARYSAHQTALAAALETSGWDGAWYRRAYDDDGLALGAADNAECRIDALAQSWAVISGAVPADRAAQAMDALETQLVDEDNGLIRLLTPPFVDTPQDPGYIKGYVAGVRENGGQYTHAACWAVLALAKLGRRERAARLLAMLSPVSHTATPAAIERYRLEPYALAADVYGTAPHIGRGGWSWYTGSAGWWARVALEAVLGITLENGRTLVIAPCIPSAWSGYRVIYRLPDNQTICTIEIKNGAGAGRVTGAWLNDSELPVSDGAARVQLPSIGGEYQITIQLG